MDYQDKDVTKTRDLTFITKSAVYFERLKYQLSVRLQNLCLPFLTDSVKLGHRFLIPQLKVCRLAQSGHSARPLL